MNDNTVKTGIAGLICRASYATVTKKRTVYIVIALHYDLCDLLS